MKFLRRKKKEKADADLYEPPVDPSSASHHDTERTNAPQQHQQQHEQQPTSDAGSSSYRYALSAYAHTISPSLSNNDGMGPGGTLRSRSTKSGGKTHATLIPVFPQPMTMHSPSSSVDGVGVELDRYSFSFDRMNEQIEAGYAAHYTGRHNERMGGASGGRESSSEWAPIPEEPRSPSDLESRPTRNADEENDDDEGECYENKEQVIGQSSSEAPCEQKRQQSSGTSYSDIRTVGPHTVISSSIQSVTSGTKNDGNTIQQQQHIPSTNSYDNAPQSFDNHSPSSIHSQRILHSKHRQQTLSDDNSDTFNPPSIHTTKSTKKGELNLQPDAIYEEHYGDAYVSQLIKYLYPTGYQSMRPRSGPWKLSIFIFCLFLWLSVFIVGHCYDRGQEYSTNYFGHADDAYLSEVDDDMMVYQHRWCGSKLIYFMWFVCVSITMCSMSYCSIIGYIKLRDLAVANGRSQPAGLGAGHGRSDCYARVDNVDGNSYEREGSVVSLASTEYSSYQQDGLGRNKYPSIYQSDGTPQFWGGHIYRPTQAAVSMTNR